MSKIQKYQTDTNAVLDHEMIKQWVKDWHMASLREVLRKCSIRLSGWLVWAG